MKATVLSDNIPAENLGCEWGLSIFIEYHGKHILLDAGASGLFLTNADVLGLNMKDGITLAANIPEFSPTRTMTMQTEFRNFSG